MNGYKAWRNFREYLYGEVRRTLVRRTSQNSVMAKFSIAPAQIPRTAGEGTLISSGIKGVVSAYTRPGEGLGHRAGVLRGPIQDPACGLPRIQLPRSS